MVVRAFNPSTQRQKQVALKASQGYVVRLCLKQSNLRLQTANLAGQRLWKYQGQICKQNSTICPCKVGTPSVQGWVGRLGRAQLENPGLFTP